MGKLRHRKVEGGTLIVMTGERCYFFRIALPQKQATSLPALLLTRRKTHPIQIALEERNEEKTPNKPQA